MAAGRSDAGRMRAGLNRRQLLTGASALTVPALAGRHGWLAAAQGVIATPAAGATPAGTTSGGTATGEIMREKLAQAGAILDALDIDLWMVVARESDTLGDPILPLILGTSVTWASAFLISRTGHHTAIVGSGDVDNVKQTGAWDDVAGYVQDFGPPLREAIAAHNPRTLALDYSKDNFMADGLTYGMYLQLQDILGSTPYWGRIVSGAPVSVRVRARKSAEEQRRLRAAVATTVEIWDATQHHLALGQSELEIAAFMHSQLQSRGITSAWDWDYCPTVIAGPNSPAFHSGPGAIKTEPGQTLSIDFGVKQDLYCSDMQRTFYFRKPGETTAPAPVQHAFDVVDNVIQTAAKALKPGARGWEVDQVGRAIFKEAGFAEWPYALGHQVGRIEHDGGTLLAPKWPRYGTLPDGVIEADEVYALEIGTTVPGYGWVSLEEDLVVTPGGAEFLAAPQRALILLG